MGKIYHVGEGEAIVTFSDSTLLDNVQPGIVKLVAAPGAGKSVKIMTWGRDNKLPEQMEDLVSNNTIVPTLMQTKRNILCGNGVYAYQVRYEKQADGSMKKTMEEVEMPSKVQAWLDGEDWPNQSNFYTYLSAAAGEYIKHGLILPEFIRNLEDKIASIEVKECKYMRASEKDANGKIGTWYWSGHWGKNAKKGQEKMVTIDIPAFTTEIAKQPKFVLAMGDFLFNDGYYPIPAWRGSKEWIEMSNFIAPFHKANLQNGYNTRWHIQIPVDYFLDYEAYQSALTEDEKKKVLKSADEKEQQFIDDINKFLAGIANTGRTVFTKYEFDRSLGKEYPGIKITPLTYDMKDEALLKLFEKSNTAAVSSQGIHPTLANIETAGKLSSGTEIRNAFLMWLIINTSEPRRHLLKPLEIAKKANGWPDNIYYAIRDYELTALSSNPSGMQQSEQPIQQ